MVERGCGGLPVVEGDELVGIITERDILGLLI
jgi:CBS domain-containing protein